MDLSGCNLEHFIQATIGGVVVKVRNKGSHGRRPLKIKGLRDIYKSEDARNLYSGSRVDEVISTSLSFDQSEVNIEMPFQPMGGNIEPSVETGINNDLDDDFSSITLKEVKDKCKRKKRKHPKSDEAVEGTAQMKEDAEFKEHLSCLRPETIANATCTSSESPIFDGPAEEIMNCQSSFESIGDLHGSIDSNIETLEPENLGSHNMVHVADSSTSACYVKMSYGEEECFDEMLQEVNISKETDCVANEESPIWASTGKDFGEIPETHQSVPSLASEPLEERTTPVPCYSPTKIVPVTSDPDIDDEGDNENVPQDNGLTITETFQSLSSSCFSPNNGIALESSSNIQSSNTTNATKTMEEFEDSRFVNTKRKSPMRLLSTRKVISPTSQEKLCQAMNTEAFSGYREKLSFEEQKDEECINKPKNTTNGSPQMVPKSILKPPLPPSSYKQSNGIEAATLDTSASKAIEFTQRQMRDIESLASKLMKELKSMKDIVEDSSKYTLDQIKSAVEEVNGTEVTTRKWLSMMGRDCTRFCKIMKKSAENKSSSSSSPSSSSSLVNGNEQHKKRKNIAFADEDGGVLCQIKLFEASMEERKINSTDRIRGRGERWSLVKGPFFLVFRFFFPMRKLCPNFDREDGLETVLEVPIPDEFFASMGNNLAVEMHEWIKNQSMAKLSAPTDVGRNAELHLLLNVVGSPLIPLQVQLDHPVRYTFKDCSIEASTAKYIVQQYIASIGGQQAMSAVHSMYVMGEVKMSASEFRSGEEAMKLKGGEVGGFVLWQKNPNLWYLELVVSGCKVSAGSDGKVTWRQLATQQSHATKGPPRPLRRFLQGLDPRSTTFLFSEAVCIGEKMIKNEDCFILKLEVNPATLKARSSHIFEIIHHTIWGYFSQRSGLLIQFDDSHLVRMSARGNDSIFWETSMESVLDDYRYIDGLNVAHSGKTIVTLYRYGSSSASHKRRMEETWRIEEVDFNIWGLSMDCFLPPADLKRDE